MKLIKKILFLLPLLFCQMPAFSETQNDSLLKTGKFGETDHPNSV